MHIGAFFVALAGLLSSIRPRSNRRRSRRNRWWRRRQSRSQTQRPIRRQPSISGAEISAAARSVTSTDQRDEIVQENASPNRPELTRHRSSATVSESGIPVADDEYLDGGLNAETSCLEEKKEYKLEHENSFGQPDPLCLNPSIASGGKGSLKCSTRENFQSTTSSHTQDSGFADECASDFISIHSDIAKNPSSDSVQGANECHQRLQKEGVVLEHVQFTPDGCGFMGSVLVLNM